jgi:hypothetical protein
MARAMEIAMYSDLSSAIEKLRAISWEILNWTAKAKRKD